MHNVCVHKTNFAQIFIKIVHSYLKKIIKIITFSTATIASVPVVHKSMLKIIFGNSSNSGSFISIRINN